ncbi:hypothetical protein [Chryseolinea lacunae]|uniref:Uncharacterized protein n=1 Tax=Chryseolinea lacunae TaxID=2801331 RepID=A0ABS1L1L9_9BACT|nr:hypothetical protein [Chryseolinea lacunae]MBL0745590.1 hypothetical protein [Chryseolinea lacunae]
MKNQRAIIYTQDIMRITGRSDRYARQLLRTIRKKLNKQKHQLISISEFCDFMQLNPETRRHFFESP